MRIITRAVVATLCLVVWTGRARSETAKEVVEKAIAAHGGADNLKKYSAAKTKTKGTISVMGLELEFDGESAYQFPDQMRNILKLDVMGVKVTVVQIYNAGKLKVTANDMSPPISDAQKNEIKESLHLANIQNLVGLLDGKKFELSLIDKTDKVGDKEVVGVLVKSKGYKDLKVFFDKKSHVILKMERKGLDPTEKEVNQVLIFSDMKKYDGILRPGKSELSMDGKKFMTSETVEYKHLDKIDKKEFEISD
jgi:hypothetical protein